MRDLLQGTKTPSESTHPLVFLVCHQTDEGWCERLKKHLNRHPVRTSDATPRPEEHGLLNIWPDRVASERKAAAVVVFLVSVDFPATTSIPLTPGHAEQQLLWVPVRACEWGAVSRLTCALDAGNTDPRPLASQPTEALQEEALKQAAANIAKVAAARDQGVLLRGAPPTRRASTRMAGVGAALVISVAIGGAWICDAHYLRFSDPRPPGSGKDSIKISVLLGDCPGAKISINGGNWIDASYPSYPSLPDCDGEMCNLRLSCTTGLWSRDQVPRSELLSWPGLVRFPHH